MTETLPAIILLSALGLQSAARFPLRIPSGDSFKIDIPVVAFADVYQPLVVDGQLNGTFVVEVAVTEAQFSDGTRWKAEGVPATIKKRPIQ